MSRKFQYFTVEIQMQRIYKVNSILQSDEEEEKRWRH